MTTLNWFGILFLFGGPACVVALFAIAAAGDRHPDSTSRPASDQRRFRIVSSDDWPYDWSNHPDL